MKNKELEIIRNKIYHKIYLLLGKILVHISKELKKSEKSKQYNFDVFTKENTDVKVIKIDKTIYNNNPGYENITYSVPPEILIYSDGPINKGEFFKNKEWSTI